MNTLFKSADMGLRKTNQPKHYHACAELYISLDGRAVNEINGKSSETLPLDVYVLTQDMTHGQPETRKYRYCLFKFNLEILCARAGKLLSEPVFQTLFIIGPQLRRQGVFEGNLQIDLLTAEFAVKTAQLLVREKDSDLRDALFFTLISVICKNAKPRIYQRQHTAYERITKAVTFMENHYMEPIRLEQLSEIAHYSKRHFTRLFHSIYQLSPTDYVNQIRLRHASVLLTESDFSISRIAENCGFTDSSMFAKAFRHHYGQTPSSYHFLSTVSSSINIPIDLLCFWQIEMVFLICSIILSQVKSRPHPIETAISQGPMINPAT
ncbi:MAG: helix-turn-helix transcriptional regulator [Clostridia bacterium]|nr:helix-turn-helix transcriptional regulator [Clostridia bacterium]